MMRSWQFLTCDAQTPGDLIAPQMFRPDGGQFPLYLTRQTKPDIVDVFNFWKDYYVFRARARPELAPTDPRFACQTYPYLFDPNPGPFPIPICRGDYLLIGHILGFKTVKGPFSYSSTKPVDDEGHDLN